MSEEAENDVQAQIDEVIGRFPLVIAGLAEADLKEAHAAMTDSMIERAKEDFRKAAEAESENRRQAAADLRGFLAMQSERPDMVSSYAAADASLAEEGK